MVSGELKKSLEKMHYATVGKRGAVQICMWTKESLLDKGFCYKQKFYGIRSHLCCQMTPVVDTCDHRCIFCWRPWEIAYSGGAEGWDAPKELIEKCVEAQRIKLSGFGGNPKVNRKKFEEAQNPMHFAISLAGEPTLYPYLPELIKELHAQGKTSFLVSNGQHPEMLAKLDRECALPTQLYISVDAPTEELYKKIDQPLRADGWQRLMKTLSMLRDLNTRKVLRFTLIRGYNMDNLDKWADIVRLAECDNLMIECKAYMHVGYSRKRLKQENMPTHDEIRSFSEELAKRLGWKILDEQVRSRVVLLAKEDFKGRIMHF